MTGYKVTPRAHDADVVATLEVWHASQHGPWDRSRLIESLRWLPVDAWSVVEQVAHLTTDALRLYSCAAAGLPSAVQAICDSPTCLGSGSFSQHPTDEASRCHACGGSGVVAAYSLADRQAADVVWIGERLRERVSA